MSFLRGLGGFGYEWVDALDLSALDAAGIDHIRMVTRATPSYPGGGQPPVFTWNDMEQVMLRINILRSAGFSIIIGAETTAQENKAIFYRQMDCDTGTGVLSLRGDPDYTRLDGFYTDIGEAISALSGYGDDILVELYAGEPGAFLRDTAPAAIAAEFLSSGTGAAQAALAALIPGAQSGDYTGWDHPAQRLFSSRIVQAICEHLTDTIRAEAPDVQIIWPGPGFGSMNGSGANPPYYDMDPSAKADCLMGAHQYSPRFFTHAGESGADIPDPRIWPDPTDSWEGATPAPDVVTENYNWDQREWTDAELEDNMQDFADWCDGKSVQGIVSEWGCLEENRSTDASQAYITAQRTAIELAELWGTEWNEGEEYVSSSINPYLYSGEIDLGHTPIWAYPESFEDRRNGKIIDGYWYPGRMVGYVNGRAVVAGELEEDRHGYREPSH